MVKLASAKMVEKERTRREKGLEKRDKDCLGFLGRRAYVDGPTAVQRMVGQPCQTLSLQGRKREGQTFSHPDMVLQKEGCPKTHQDGEEEQAGGHRDPINEEPERDKTVRSQRERENKRTTAIKVLRMVDSPNLDPF